MSISLTYRDIDNTSVDEEWAVWQDNNGKIFTACYGGDVVVYTFDGTSLTYLAKNSVKSENLITICGDNNGNIVCAAGSYGFYSYYYNSGLNTLGYVSSKSADPGNVRDVKYDSNHGHWIMANDSNVVVYNSSLSAQVTSISTGNTCNSIFYKNGYVYAVTSSQLKVYSYNGTNLTHISSIDISDLCYSNISVDSNNYIYVTSNSGLKAFSFNGTTLSYITKIGTTAYPSHIACDAYGNIFTTGGHYYVNAYKFNGTTYSSEGSYTNNDCSLQGLYAKEGNLFVCDGRATIGNYTSSLFAFTYSLPSVSSESSESSISSDSSISMSSFSESSLSDSSTSLSSDSSESSISSESFESKSSDSSESLYSYYNDLFLNESKDDGSYYKKIVATADYLFVACGIEGIKIYNRRTLELITSRTNLGNVLCIDYNTYNGSWVSVIGGGTLYVFSFNGTTLTLIDSENAGYYDVYKSGSSIYCAGINEIKKYSFNGTTLTLSYTNRDQIISYGISPADGYMVFAAGGHGLRLYNTSLVYVSTKDDGGTYYDVVKYGTYYFAACGDSGIRAYTLSNRNFTLLATRDDGGDYRNITVDANGNIYCMCGNDGMKVYTFDGTTFTLQSGKDDGGYYNDASIYGNYIYNVGDDYGIRVYTYQNPSDSSSLSVSSLSESSTSLSSDSSDSSMSSLSESSTSSESSYSLLSESSFSILSESSESSTSSDSSSSDSGSKSSDSSESSESSTQPISILSMVDSLTGEYFYKTYNKNRYVFCTTSTGLHVHKISNSGEISNIVAQDRTRPTGYGITGVGDYVMVSGGSYGISIYHWDEATETLTYKTGRDDGNHYDVYCEQKDADNLTIFSTNSNIAQYNYQISTNSISLIDTYSALSGSYICVTATPNYIILGFNNVIYSFSRAGGVIADTYSNSYTHGGTNYSEMETNVLNGTRYIFAAKGNALLVYTVNESTGAFTKVANTSTAVYKCLTTRVDGNRIIIFGWRDIGDYHVIDLFTFNGTTLTLCDSTENIGVSYANTALSMDANFLYVGTNTNTLGLQVYKWHDNYSDSSFSSISESSTSSLSSDSSDSSLSSISNSSDSSLSESSLSNSSESSESESSTSSLSDSSTSSNSSISEISISSISSNSSISFSSDSSTSSISSLSSDSESSASSDSSISESSLSSDSSVSSISESSTSSLSSDSSISESSESSSSSVSKVSISSDSSISESSISSDSSTSSDSSISSLSESSNSSLSESSVSSNSSYSSLSDSSTSSNSSISFSSDSSLSESSISSLSFSSDSSDSSDSLISDSSESSMLSLSESSTSSDSSESSESESSMSGISESSLSSDSESSDSSISSYSVSSESSISESSLSDSSDSSSSSISKVSISSDSSLSESSTSSDSSISLSSDSSISSMSSLSESSDSSMSSLSSISESSSSVSISSTSSGSSDSSVSSISESSTSLSSDSSDSSDSSISSISFSSDSSDSSESSISLSSESSDSLSKSSESLSSISISSTSSESSESSISSISTSSLSESSMSSESSDSSISSTSLSSDSSSSVSVSSTSSDSSEYSTSSTSSESSDSSISSISKSSTSSLSSDSSISSISESSESVSSVSSESSISSVSSISSLSSDSSISSFSLECERLQYKIHIEAGETLELDPRYYIYEIISFYMNGEIDNFATLKSSIPTIPIYLDMALFPNVNLEYCAFENVYIYNSKINVLNGKDWGGNMNIYFTPKVDYNCLLNKYIKKIGDLILEMSTATGYNYDWKTTQLKQQAIGEYPRAEIYVVEENNLDETEDGLGSHAYTNECTVEIVVRNKLKLSSTNVIFDYYGVEHLLIDDLKRKFGKEENFNLGGICDKFMYKGFVRDPENINETSRDQFTPHDIKIRFKLVYSQNRNFPDLYAS